MLDTSGVRRLGPGRQICSCDGCSFFKGERRGLFLMWIQARGGEGNQHSLRAIGRKPAAFLVTPVRLCRLREEFQQQREQWRCTKNARSLCPKPTRVANVCGIQSAVREKDGGVDRKKIKARDHAHVELTLDE